MEELRIKCVGHCLLIVLKSEFDQLPYIYLS